MTIVQVFKTTFRVVHMVYSSRLYPRAEPRGFSLQWIKKHPVANYRVLLNNKMTVIKYAYSYQPNSLNTYGT